MTTYTCPRCGYNTYHICAYKKHLQRQKICPAKHAEMSQNDLYEHFTNSFEERKVKVYKCDICNQAFDTPQKKYQHKLRCSSKNVNEQIREQVQQQVKQILSNVNIGNTTNINNVPMVHQKGFGYVYCMSNKSLPGVYKIGRCGDIVERQKHLSGTSIPYEYHCEFSIYVDDCVKVEAKIHKILSAFRVNPKREFFKVSLKYIYIIFDQVQPLSSLPPCTEEPAPDLSTPLG